MRENKTILHEYSLRGSFNGLTNTRLFIVIDKCILFIGVKIILTSFYNTMIESQFSWEEYLNSCITIQYLFAKSVLLYYWSFD